MTDETDMTMDEHDAVQALLPWHATGQLETEDQAKVRAHLADCAICRADAAQAVLLGDRVAAMPLDVDLGWAAMRARIVANDQEAAGNIEVAASPRRHWWSAGWLIPAQAAVLIFGVLIFRPGEPIGAYHALGASRTVPATGNAIIIFRPDASAQAIADILTADGAKIVDGPTDAGAFVLHIAADHRASAIARLHARPAVTMAEPIDL